LAAFAGLDPGPATFPAGCLIGLFKRRAGQTRPSPPVWSAIKWISPFSS